MNPADLLSPDRATRVDAIESIFDGASEQDRGTLAYALRDVALGDSDAGVRALAVAVLARAGVRPAASVIHDTLYDTHPSVRRAACRGVANVLRRPDVEERLAEEILSLLRRLALEEPIWWVRRSAVVAFARAGRDASIELLAKVLDDPFWRVRHAAARALVALGARDAQLAEAIGAADARSDRARAALAYVARRLGLPVDAIEGESVQRPALGHISDPDPAVVTARLEDGRAATLAELVEYLGDPHDALRRVAAERLARRGDVRAWMAAALWLEEPRIPYAAATVVDLLDRLPDPEALVGRALADADARPGAAAWALSFLGSARRFDQSADIARALATRHALVRRASAGALAALLSDLAEGDARANSIVSALAGLLGDADGDVRRIAAHALATSRSSVGHAAVARTTLSDQPALMRRMIVIAAGRADAPACLREAATDEDPRTRATALQALAERSLLDAGARAEASTSPDPWIRRAVLDRSVVLEVVASDPDPSVRRTAFVLAAREGLGIDASRIAATASDPWLRANAAERLARSSDVTDLERLLLLAVDPCPAVRAAAADVTVIHPDLAARATDLRGAVTGPARAVADAWRGAWDQLVVASATPVQDERSARTQVERDAPIASPRALGKTGIAISPIAISGVNDLPVGAFFRALDAGCNLFYWEPRYTNLTAFLRASRRRRTPPFVVCGSYDASERGVRRDIERALKRLRRERLDVFLLFWVRSPARLEGGAVAALERAKREGLVGAVGFSTHDRDLAATAVGRDPWDAIMVRHSAAHPGAERGLFERAQAAGVGVLSFSATSYGRLLSTRSEIAPPSAAECYRYSLSQAGVTACISAPRGARELVSNLEVLREPTLVAERIEAIRAHGRLVRDESLDFASHVRRFPAVPEGLAELDTDEGIEPAGIEPAGFEFSRYTRA